MVVVLDYKSNGDLEMGTSVLAHSSKRVRSVSEMPPFVVLTNPKKNHISPGQ